MIDPSTPKMILGPVQTQWLANLRAYPERQMKNKLGTGTAEHYLACCLGELLLTKHRHDGTEPFFDDDGDLRCFEDDDNLDSSYGVLEDYGRFGLYTNAGWINVNNLRHDEPLADLDSLARLNDEGWTWPQIADLIERNPEAFFNHAF